MPEEGGAATTRVEVRPTRRGSCPGGCRVSAPQGRGTAIPAPGLASKPLPERLTPGRVPSRAALPVWTTTRPPPAPPPGAEERRPPVWAPGLAIEGRAPPTPLAGRPQAALPAGPRRAARGSARGPAPDLRRPLCGTPSPTVARLAHASRFLPRRRRLARRAPRNASDPLKVRAAPGICRAPGSADPCCTARRSLRRGAAAALPGGYRSPVAGAARPLSLQVSADAVPAVPGHPSRRAAGQLCDLFLCGRSQVGQRQMLAMGPAAVLVLLLLVLGGPEAKRTAGKGRLGRGRLERALGGYGETAPRGRTPRLGERETLSRAVVSYGTSAWNSCSLQK